MNAEKNFHNHLEPEDIGEIEATSIKTWGRDLHKDPNSTNPHITTLDRKLGGELSIKAKGAILDAGCGAGSDLKHLSKLEKASHITAVDIGENIEELAKEYPCIDFHRASLLRLPFADSQFDVIYSYGVIHHTSDPKKAVSEISRVLKDDGYFFAYVYTSHQKNFPKRLALKVEPATAKLLKYLPKQTKLTFIYLLAAVSFIAFCIPSIALKKLGLAAIAEKLPMNWGTTPKSIIPDIKDRLEAPVNHRYSEKSFTDLLSANSLQTTKSVEDFSGIYISAKKIS